MGIAAVYRLFRKRGLYDTLEILYRCSPVKFNEFSKRIKGNGEGYINAFYRVKKQLLDLGIIKFGLDRDFDKVLVLTEKGRQLYEKIREIEEILEGRRKE